jgi:hypothetical protein
MIVFAAVVIIFARFFRTGLWGMAERLLASADKPAAAREELP